MNFRALCLCLSARFSANWFSRKPSLELYRPAEFSRLTATAAPTASFTPRMVAGLFTCTPYPVFTATLAEEPHFTATAAPQALFFANAGQLPGCWVGPETPATGQVSG